MRQLNQQALDQLAAVLYEHVGKRSWSWSTGPWAEHKALESFFREAGLAPPELLSPTGTQTQNVIATKNWLLKYLDDLNSRTTRGLFLPAAIECLMAAFLNPAQFTAGRDQRAWAVDRILDLVGLGVRAEEGQYHLLVRSARESERELEQKFKILFSANQAALDFSAFIGASLNPVLVFFDIDDFKALNTKLQEAEVDRVVLPAFQKLVRGLVEPLSLAYRHGGDEFLVIIPNGDIEMGLRIAECVRGSVETWRDGGATITISAGVASSPRHGVLYEDVLLAANRAKSQAKQAGKNRVEAA